jgi:hypothetical protein
MYLPLDCGNAGLLRKVTLRTRESCGASPGGEQRVVIATRKRGACCLVA